MAIGGPLNRYEYDRLRGLLPSQQTINTYNPTSYGYYGSSSSGGNVGDLGRLTSNVTNLNIANQQAANAARIPNAPGLEAQSSKMIQDQLMGKLPADVVALLGQSAGERAVGGGMIGAPASWAAYQKALGLTSTDLQERGQRNLSAALARNPAARAMDAESQIITPYQQAELEIQRQNAETARINALRSGRGGGGDGGGGYRTTGDQGYGGYIPTAQDLFGGMGRGTVYSPAAPRAAPTYASYADAPALEGYYPSSQGTIYMGSREGYDPEFLDYTSGGWADEFFGDYGG
jgi:hypothetical protein